MRFPFVHLDGDQIVCECGNDPGGAGFDTCDRHGHDQEPLAESDWNFTYRCNGCGLIVQTDEDYTRIEVVGRAAGWEE